MFVSGRERVPPMKRIEDFESSLNQLAFEANKRTASRFDLPISAQSSRVLKVYGCVNWSEKKWDAH